MKAMFNGQKNMNLVEININWYTIILMGGYTNEPSRNRNLCY